MESSYSPFDAMTIAASSGPVSRYWWAGLGDVANAFTNEEKRVASSLEIFHSRRRSVPEISCIVIPGRDSSSRSVTTVCFRGVTDCDVSKTYDARVPLAICSRMSASLWKPLSSPTRSRVDCPLNCSSSPQRSFIGTPEHRVSDTHPNPPPQSRPLIRGAIEWVSSKYCFCRRSSGRPPGCHNRCRSPPSSLRT